VIQEYTSFLLHQLLELGNILGFKLTVKGIEQNNLLVLKIIVFNESLQRHSWSVPPDGRTEVNRLVST